MNKRKQPFDSHYNYEKKKLKVDENEDEDEDSMDEEMDSKEDGSDSANYKTPHADDYRKNDNTPMSNNSRIIKIS